MISCTEAVRQLWEYLENEVSAKERDAVEEHLAFCRRCCGEVEFADELRAVLASAAETNLPHEVETRLLGALDMLGPGCDSTRDGGRGRFRGRERP